MKRNQPLCTLGGWPMPRFSTIVSRHVGTVRVFRLSTWLMNYNYEHMQLKHMSAHLKLVYIYICLCVCTYSFTYTYIYIYMKIHILHVHTCTYTHRFISMLHACIVAALPTLARTAHARKGEAPPACTLRPSCWAALALSCVVRGC